MAAERVGSKGSVDALDPNPGMLAVATETVPDTLGVEWHQASAEDMPLPDETFDVVLCQLSLQFVSDRGAALREMHRVLAPGGRLLLNVPGPAGPPFEILAETMGSYIAPEAKGFVQHVFSLHDTDEIRGLLDDAGFDDIEIEANTGSLTLPPPKDFFWQYVWSTPLAEVVSQADDEAQEALERAVVDAWEPFEESGGMTYEQRIVLAKARR
jgi:ubiquinone/menaquinone biosynthesis C-methylase UbiE